MSAKQVPTANEPSKAEMVRMVSQFLLQNGLPVTAAALQKECEKLLTAGKSPSGTQRTARGRQGQQSAEKCLADWLHRREQQTMPPTHVEPKSPPPPPPPRPSAAHGADRRSGISPTRKPPHSSRRAATVRQTQRQMKHGNGSTNTSQSARIGRSNGRAASHQRTVEKTATDTEESSWLELENAGGQHRKLRKAESLGSIAANQPPPDPVQARPEAPSNVQQEEKNLSEEEQNRWLCAHLDLALVGQTLLRAGPGREPALLLQALRHQLTKAGTMADREANLRVFAAKDLFQLRNRKQSLASLLLTDSSQMPELKEQLARFLSAITSFRRGRDYLLSIGQGRQLLYETSMALKGRRVVGNALEHLLAALQKLSIRPAAQKELLLNGLMEWLALQLVQPRLGPAHLEFGTALLHNLAVNQLAQSSMLRHKDQLLAAMYWLLGSTHNGQVLHCICGTLFTLLGHPRVRQCARERGDLERAIGERIKREQQRPELQRQLLACSQILRGELEPERRKAPSTTGSDEDTFPDYLEAEIDSTDPLVPSLCEPFGQTLLVQRFLQSDAVPPPRRFHLVQFGIEEDQESVPGVVPVQRRSRQVQSRPQKPANAGRLHASPQRKPKASNGLQSAPSKEIGCPIIRQVHFERTNSMSSHATFVVENSIRRPLLATTGLANAVASMKTNPAMDRIVQQKLVPQQQRKRAGEIENLEIESSSSEALQLEESLSNTKVVSQKPLDGRSTATTIAEVVKLSQRQNRPPATAKTTAEMAKMFSSKLRTQREKWPRREATPLITEEEEALAKSAANKSGIEAEKMNEEAPEDNVKEESNYEEYMAIFAARPKLNRTPPEFPDDLNE